ncbi:MAG: hypothetical protein ABFS56_00155 [Pseudomonadota bacterium]
MSEDAKSSRAWLLDFGGGLQAAIGYHEMWQALVSPTLFKVPCTPHYCSEVLIFQKEILPVLDMSSLLERDKISPLMSQVVGIAVYQEVPTLPIRYACLRLASMPKGIFVSDDQACDLLADQFYWKPLALSSFSRDDVVIPIIDLAYLFSEDFNAFKQGSLV